MKLVDILLKLLGIKKEVPVGRVFEESFKEDILIQAEDVQ